MSEKTYKITVTRTDEYEITIDHSIINEDVLKEYSEYFSHVDDQEEYAKNLALSLMRLGSDHSFYEGFGYVKKQMSNGHVVTDYKAGFEKIQEDEYTKGISVRIITEDNDYETDVESIS